MVLSPSLTPNEALSGIFGTISLVSWLIVLVPQLYENYVASSADAISVSFLLVWFIGDIANLAGALWAGLVPTVIALAVYFCIADTLLIVQCVYYNMMNARKRRREEMLDGNAPSGTNRVAEEDENDREQEPLLNRRTSIQSNGSIGLPGSHKRRRRSTLNRVDENEAVPKETTTHRRVRAFATNLAAIVGVCAAGAFAWLLAYYVGIWKPAPAPGQEDQSLVYVSIGNGIVVKKQNESPLGAEILGYASAIAYLGARIPQIYKNWKNKSCAGLSLLFFLLSLLGNLTYGAGILCHSVDQKYVLTNLPWLIGSLGTMGEDVMIFIQFSLYGDKVEQDSAVED